MLLIKEFTQSEKFKDSMDHVLGMWIKRLRGSPSRSCLASSSLCRRAWVGPEQGCGWVEIHMLVGTWGGQDWQHVFYVPPIPLHIVGAILGDHSLTVY